MRACIAAIMVVPALVAGTLGHGADAAAQSVATVPHIGLLDGISILARVDEVIE
ncbi:hypothetical protein SAMN05444161_2594 [Rhizobiales bacterium GAS191]|nr:hypothetical protein SAMN05444161_2594 [Rhizobiales bacterium GAS191]